MLAPESPVKIADPLAMHVSLDGQILYLVSGQCNWQAPSNSIVHEVSTSDFVSLGRITVQDMEQVTAMTEDPATGDLWIAGFNRPEVPAYPNPLELFYLPVVARVPNQTETTQAVSIGQGVEHNLALPTSIIWLGQ